MSRNYSSCLHCSQETFDLIVKDCKEEFLKHHPELEGTHITQNQILNRLAKYYMGERI